MPNYDTPFSGLYLNPHKTEGDKRPHYTGRLYINLATLRYLNDCKDAGMDLEISVGAWEQTAKVSRKKYLSLEGKPPRQQSMTRQSPDDNDEIPF